MAWAKKLNSELLESSSQTYGRLTSLFSAQTDAITNLNVPTFSNHREGIMASLSWNFYPQPHDHGHEALSLPLKEMGNDRMVHLSYCLSIFSLALLAATLTVL